HGVRVIEREATLLEAVVVVDLGAVQVQIAFAIHNDSHTVAIGLGVILFIVVGVEAKAVFKTAATSGLDTNAHKRSRIALLIFHQPLDFSGGLFGQQYSHFLTPLLSQNLG